MSKRAMIAAIVSGLIAVAKSMGWIDTATAAMIAGLAASWIAGDTLRPSGTRGIAGGNGAIPGK